MQPFRMPKLGADMTEGRLLQWIKRPGESIARGEVIALVETDKANVDVESFVDGVLSEVLVEPSDQWLPVGTTLAMISTSDEQARGVAQQAPAAPQPGPMLRPPAPPMVARAPAATPPAPEIDQPSPAPLPARERVTPLPAAMTISSERTPVSPAERTAISLVERIAISPVARRRATALGIDLRQLRGSGPGGRIVLRDVEAHAAQSAATPAPASVARTDATDKRQRMREAIAAAMSRSKREIPHYYLATSIDFGRALQWMTDSNAQRGVADRLIPGVLFIKAVALALQAVPELNGFYLDGRAQPSAEIHVGTAIALRGGGLVAPALLHTAQRTLTDLMHDYQDLVQRARAGSLRGAEMLSPTITVTSLGDRGVETVFGVIYPPQVALVGVGRPAERPWVHDGRIAVRPVVQITLSADHRASDGHCGALFLDAIDHLLQEPEKL